MKPIAALACAAALFPSAALSGNQDPARRFLDATYGPYDPGRQCWVAKTATGRYCMKIDRQDLIDARTGSRLYLLVSGEGFPGDDHNAHIEPGLIGAFVLERGAGNRFAAINGDPGIPLGSFGAAPVGWRLVRLGPDDYWGWEKSVVDGNQGFFTGFHSILAPYGTGIKELGGFIDSYEDSGSFPAAGQGATAYKADIEPNRTGKGVKVFPLRAVLTGKKKGKALPGTTWTIPFDTESWSYREPVGWPPRLEAGTR